MSKQQNVLYPVNYIEPAPPPPVEDTAEFGRDFVRLRQIINGAVPAGGTPMTIAQLARIVRGAPNRGGGMVYVESSTAPEIRAAALDPSMGITSDPTVRGIRREEALAVFREVWTAREPTWTFNPAGD